MEEQWLTINQIVGNRKADPPIEPIVHKSKATIWNWVRDGHFPPPVKIAGSSLWKKSEVIAALEKGSGDYEE